MSQTSTALVARIAKPPAARHISPENWQLITDVIWPTAKDPLVIVTAWNYCMARKLDPLKKPVHIVETYSKVARKKIETIWPGIGELEITAVRSGWCGLDLPVWGPMIDQVFSGSFENDDGSARRVEIELRYPEWCSVTVYRMVAGERRAFAEQVFWIEAYARQGFRSELPNEMWQKRPRGQLGKVAKAAALRAAFPEDTGGMPTADEMEGQEVEGGPIIDHGPVPPSGLQRREQARVANGNGNGAGWPTPPHLHETVAEPREDEPDGDLGGWQSAIYPIVYPNGEVVTKRIGSEYLQEMRKGVTSLVAHPETLAKVHAANRDALAQISAFDPEAAQEVERMFLAAAATKEQAT